MITQEHHDDDPESTPRMPLVVDDLIGGLITQPQHTPAPDFDDGEASGVSGAGFQTTQKPRGRPKLGSCEKPKLKATRSRSSKHTGDDAVDGPEYGASTKYGFKQLPKGCEPK